VVRKAVTKAVKAAVDKAGPPPGAGSWTLGVATGPTRVRRFRLYRPPTRPGTQTRLVRFGPNL